MEKGSDNNVFAVAAAIPAAAEFKSLFEKWSAEARGAREKDAEYEKQLATLRLLEQEKKKRDEHIARALLEMRKEYENQEAAVMALFSDVIQHGRYIFEEQCRVALTGCEEDAKRATRWTACILEDLKGASNLSGDLNKRLLHIAELLGFLRAKFGPGALKVIDVDLEEDKVAQAKEKQPPSQSLRRSKRIRGASSPISPNDDDDDDEPVKKGKNQDDDDDYKIAQGKPGSSSSSSESGSVGSDGDEDDDEQYGSGSSNSGSDEEDAGGGSFDEDALRIFFSQCTEHGILRAMETNGWWKGRYQDLIRAVRLGCGTADGEVVALFDSMMQDCLTTSFGSAVILAKQPFNGKCQFCGCSPRASRHYLKLSSDGRVIVRRWIGNDCVVLVKALIKFFRFIFIRHVEPVTDSTLKFLDKLMTAVLVAHEAKSKPTRSSKK